MNVQVTEQNLLVRCFIHTACYGCLLGGQCFDKNIAALFALDFTNAARLAKPVIISSVNVKPDRAEKKHQKTDG